MHPPYGLGVFLNWLRRDSGYCSHWKLGFSDTKDFKQTMRKAKSLPSGPQPARLDRVTSSCLDYPQALRRLSAGRLRSWIRREVSRTMVPDCTNWVKVRDTVSMVSPR